MRRLIAIGCALSVLLLLGTGIARMFALPQHGPSTCTLAQSEGRKRVVLLGDSLTHATLSADWASQLEQRLGNGFEVINAGVNAELAWGGLQRIGSVIACQPAIVFVLLGTNDAIASMSPELAERYIGWGKLPKTPDEQWFIQNYRAVITALQTRTSAQVVAVSIPTIGEDTQAEAYKRSAHFARLTQQIAAELNASYLPFHETMDEKITAATRQDQPDFDHYYSIMWQAAALYYWTPLSWNRIGGIYGMRLHSDLLHLSEDGAALLARLAADFIGTAEHPKTLKYK